MRAIPEAAENPVKNSPGSAENGGRALTIPTVAVDRSAIESGGDWLEENAIKAIPAISVELTPDSPYTYFYLALSLAAVGLKDEAWTMANTGKKLNDGLPLGEGYFGYVAGLPGHTVEARSVAGELEARREKGYGPALPIAWTYLGLGETTAALEWLEKALAEHDPFLGSAMVFPGYDAIREQPRFRWLAHQLKLST
jgi:tetratricopeptide (TPR) repeat protein